MLLANFVMVVQGIKNPTSSPSYCDTSRGCPNSRFPVAKFPQNIAIDNRTLYAVTKRPYLLLAHKKPWSYSRNHVHQLLPHGLSQCFLPFCLDLILLPSLHSSSFSFSVIPSIVFGILFWFLILAIIFFLCRRDHHCGIDWWWWKTPHKSDPMCSPGTFTHNRALKPTKPKHPHIPGTYC